MLAYPSPERATTEPLGLARSSWPLIGEHGVAHRLGLRAGACSSARPARCRGRASLFRASNRESSWYARLSMTWRISVLTDQPFSMNETASWSSSSGWLGGWPAAPKLSGVGTRPRPNRCSQTRLTSTRAVSGFSGDASHSASSSRPLPWRIVGDARGHDLHHPARHDLAGLVELAALVERTVRARSDRSTHAHGEGVGRSVGLVRASWLSYIGIRIPSG